MAFVNNEFCLLLVLSFLHFLWQASAIGGLYAIGLWMFKSANARYLAGLASLTLLAICVPVNYFMLNSTFERGLAIREVKTQTESVVVASETEQAATSSLSPLDNSTTLTIKLPRDSAGDGVTAATVDSAAGGPVVWLQGFAPLFLSAYLIGVALFAVRLATGVYAGARYRRCAIPVQQPELIQNTLEAVLFFHPVVWWVSSRIRLEREYCCDAAVVELGSDARRYAESLLDVAAMGASRPMGEFSVAAVGSGSQLRQRINLLLGTSLSRSAQSSKHRWIETGSLLSIAALLCLGLVMGTAANANAEPPADDAVERTATDGDSDQAKTDLTPPNVTPPKEITGVVVDEDGKPIEGVLVDVWTWVKGTETRTDAAGEFTLDTQSDDRERVEVRYSKDGYSPHYVVQQPTGVAALRITLDRSTYVEGRLLDSGGKPVARATIRGEQGSKQADGVQIGGVTTTTQTDELGNYRMYVFPDTYELQVSVAGRGAIRMPGIKIDRGEAKSLDIRLEDAVRFRAQVVDASSGKPVEGVVLFSWRNPKVLGKSDSDGKIVIDEMLPGQFQFDVGTGKPYSMRGSKIYRTGWMGRWWSADAIQDWEQKTVEPNGWQRNFDNLTFELKPDMGPVTIEVERGVVFEGTVYDPDGEPVRGATVAPAKTGSGNSLTGDTRYSATTKRDGSYRVIMPAGNDFQYNLMVHDGKYQEWRKWANGVTDPLESKPGQTFSDFDLTLSRPCSVKGKVTSSLDRKLGGLKVRAHAVDLRGNRYYDPTVARTDANGSFELEFIRPGKHFIQVEPFYLAAGQAPGPSTVSVELSEGEVRDGIELEVADSTTTAVDPAMAARSFEVKITDDENAAVSDVAVFVIPASNPAQVGLFGDRAGLAKRLRSVSDNPNRHVTDGDGTITVDGSKLFAIQAYSRSPVPATVVCIDAEKNRGAIATLFPDAKSDSLTITLVPLCDVAANVDLDQLVDGGKLARKSGGIVALTKGSSLIAMDQSASVDFRMQLPPGEYQLMTVFPNSNSTKTSWSIPDEASYEPDPIILKPNPLSLLVGKQAPKLRGIEAWHGGDAIELDQLRGRVVILDFWGYWCGPCLAAMPHLMELSDEFAEEELTIIGIHDSTVTSSEQLDKQIENAREKIWNGRPLPFRTAIAGGGTAKVEGTESSVNGQVIADYGIQAFPTTLLIDKLGVIVGPLNLQNIAKAKVQIQKAIDQPVPPAS